MTQTARRTLRAVFVIGALGLVSDFVLRIWLRLEPRSVGIRVKDRNLAGGTGFGVRFVRD